MPTLRKVLCLVIVLALAGLSGCSSSRWYKGNTHVHTVLSGHADSSPEVVAQWYLERGYNFLCLSEHNQFIDPASVSLPEGRRENFILIPSEEISGKGVHTTAMNIDNLVSPELVSPKGVSKTQMMQGHVHGTEAQHGHAILNHPNFHYANTVNDIRPVKGLHMFELYNGHPSVHNHGDKDHISTQVMWDQLLSKGMKIYGVSSDDAHAFAKFGNKISNPGRGWVMVRAKSLTPDAISEAMFQGDFYATNGVILSQVDTKGGQYRVTVNQVATTMSLQSAFLAGHVSLAGQAGYLIEFIGPQGQILKAISGTHGTFPIISEHAYLRVKVTYTRQTKTGYESFYAWTQPDFTDERK